MTDLSQISDADLMTALGQSKEQPGGDLSSVSDADLMQALKRSKEPQMSMARAAQLGIQQGMTFGFGDEIMAGLMTPFELGRQYKKEGTLDVGKAYSTRLDKERAELKQAEEEHPIATGINDVLGGLGTGGILSKGGATLLNVAKPTYGAMIGRGAAEGAAYGAARGLGDGEGAEDRLKRAAVGGVGGAVVGGAMGALGARMAKTQANKAVPSVDDLKAASQAAYKEADDAGLVVANKGFGDTVDDIATALHGEGLDETLHPRATAALARLEKAKEAGSDLNLKELDTLRRVAGAAGKSADADERRIASILIDKLDDFMEGLTPGDIVAGDAEKGIAALGKARDLWARKAKGETISNILERAELDAPNFSASGKENAIRTGFRNLAKNEKAMRRFSKVEQEMIKRVAKGGPIQNMVRMLGKFAPRGVVSSGISSGIGYTVAGPAGAAAMMGAGEVGRRAATAMTSRNASAADALIRNGGKLPDLAQLTGPQRAMVELIMRGGSQESPSLPDIMNTIP